MEKIMKTSWTFKSIFIVIFIGFLFANGTSYAAPNTGTTMSSNLSFEKAKEIFSRHCITCHGGLVPAQQLSLESEDIISYTVNVNSMEKTDLKIIDPANPQNSYLLMKIKNDKNISGKPMPLKKEPLREEEIKTIEAWISGLPETYGEASGESQKTTARPGKNAFWGTRLINLDTPNIIPKKHFLFRVSHRFIPAAKEGYDYFFGFNGPAVVFIGMGYGISHSLDFTIGHSNLLNEWEFMFKWRILSPKSASAVPLAIALHTGGNWITQTLPGESVGDSDKLKFNFQLSAAYALSPRISLLLVPGYSSSLDHFGSESASTLALGTGLSIKLTRNLAIMGEWVPVLSGIEFNSNGWGVGFQYKIGKHLFQVFMLNSMGITIDQFMPGGDLRLKEDGFRFGFTIFREL